jgi:hypothetical protein
MPRVTPDLATVADAENPVADIEKVHVVAIVASEV